MTVITPPIPACPDPSKDPQGFKVYIETYLQSLLEDMKITESAATATGDHGDLTGLTDNDHPQYQLAGVSIDITGSIQVDGDFSIDGTIVANNIVIDGTAEFNGVVNIFGTYTNEDDDSNAMVGAHVYLANQDGLICIDGDSAGIGTYIRCYIGDTTDPIGAGDRIRAIQSAGGAGYDMGTSFSVPNGKYFDISANATINNIFWFPYGILVKPTDID